MPSVSPAQHRAMEAAAHGHSTLGIPESVGNEFARADDAKMAAAGVIFLAPDGRALFLKRGANGDHAGEWCFPGGGIEQGEGPRRAARREANEETGFTDTFDADFADEGWRPVHRATSDDGVDFTTFAHPVNEAFEPKLNDEHEAHAWAPLDAAPQPLHPSVAKLIKEISAKVLATDSLAFDRASVRKIDQDGHLFVERTPISKANVCPYRGSEIPGFEELGLEPDRIYKLLRHPDELKKAAPSFRGKPLMLIHKPISADDHPREVVVGAIGTDVEFEKPYLWAPLSAWDAEAIALIDSGEQKELSSSYHYRADMTPGTYEGEDYDGVMRDISGNHVAMVKEGRAGPDVVVSDSTEELTMSKKTALTRKAAMTQGALIAYLMPKLAADAKIDLTPVLAGVTGANFKEKRPKIAADIRAATRGKLAKDMSIDDVEKVLEVLDNEKPVEDAEANNATASGNPRDRVSNFLKGKLSDDDMKACDELWGDPQEAMDAEADKKKEDEPEKKAEDEEKDKEPPVTKKAMDEALAKNGRAIEKRMRDNFVAVRDAEEAVRPYVGKLAVACDSAEQIYRTALVGLGVAEDELKDVPLAGLKVVLKQIPVPGTKTATTKTPAMDSTAVGSFHEMFPEAKANRLGTF